MRILVITRGCWDKSNNTGNTMDNIFGNFENCEIYNLYFRTELPKDNPCKKIFQISEQQLVKNILKKKPCGKYVSNSSEKDSDANIEAKMYNQARKRKLTIFSLFRELIWSLGKWKNSNLDNFLDEVKPDIVFMPVYNCWYPHKVLNYIKKKTNAEIVLFHADDNYTLKQISFSPLYWLYRFRLRHWVRKSEKISSLDYAISDIQREEYSKAFKKDIKILYKGQDFTVSPEKKSSDSGVIKMVFTGNISVGRYKSLAMIGREIKKINSDKKRIELDIYTKTPMTKKMKRALDIEGAVNLKGGVDASEIMEIQRNADVLVHAESFDLKSKLAVRLSFSTKIVDYLYNSKCIFAIGPKDVASIKYLVENDAAIVAFDKKSVEEKLKALIDNPELLLLYGEKAWECGKKNHQISQIQEKLHKDFCDLLKKEREL